MYLICRISMMLTVMTNIIIRLKLHTVIAYLRYSVFGLEMQILEGLPAELGHSDGPLSLSFNIFLSRTGSKITGVSVAPSSFLSRSVCFLQTLSSKTSN